MPWTRIGVQDDHGRVVWFNLPAAFVTADDGAGPTKVNRIGVVMVRPWADDPTVPSRLRDLGDDWQVRPTQNVETAVTLFLG